MIRIAPKSWWMRFMKRQYPHEGIKIIPWPRAHQNNLGEELNQIKQPTLLIWEQ